MPEVGGEPKKGVYDRIFSMGTLAVCLLASVAGSTLIVIFAGTDSLVGTGFHDLTILLAGALCGRAATNGRNGNGKK